RLKSPPKLGPLRSSILSWRFLGGTLASVALPGVQSLVKLARPMAKALMFVSQQAIAPIVSAFANLGSRLGRLLLGGPLRFLQRSVSQFLRTAVGTPTDNLLTRMATQLKDLG